MLFWTCPECGRECSPALRQCPACPPPSERQQVADATLGRSQADGGILALAQNLETIHAVPVLAPVPEQPVQALENGHNSHGSLTATLIEEAPMDPSAGLSARFVVQDPAAPAEEALLVLAEETLEIPVKQAVDSLVRPLVESVDTAETGAAEPPETEAAVLRETQPALDREEPLVIAQSSSEPAATPQLEPDSTVAESETILPEPEPAIAAPAPSSQPELILQAGSPCEVTAIPELYVAVASWAHQIRELEQALEPEAQSPEQESEQASAPEVLSAIEASHLAAGPEVQEFAVQDRDDQGPEPESPAAPLEPDPAGASWASEPEVLPIVEARDLTASAEVQEPAFGDSAADASPESTAVPEIDGAGNSLLRETREPEQVSTPEILPAIAAPHLAATPEVQEPALEHQDALQSPPAVEALSAAETPSELAPVPSPAAPALVPNDVSAQAEEPEPAAVAGQQLALDLAPDPEPPAQLEPLVLTTAGAEGEVAPQPPAASLSEDATPAESPAGLESPVAAQEPPLEPPIDERETRELEATEALLGAIQLQAEALVDTIHAEVEAERAAIRDVVASFRQCCSTSLLTAPAEIVTAPAPPIFDWIRKPRQVLQPLPPPAENLAWRSARPQPLTLAGPCLAPDLRNLAELQGPARSRKPRAFPGWVASLMGATLLFLLAVTSLQYLSSQKDGKATTPAGQQAAVAPNTEALDKSVEISGLRLATTWSGKQQVRFLIVNHSAQDLSGVTLQVVVRSSEAPGSAPILVIHAPLSSLGPNQSKEIKTALDSDIPASALSDWRALRTDIQVLHGE